MTCRYRCGDACAHDAPNTSGNAYFGDVLAAAISRRGLLKGGAAAALVLGAGASLTGKATPAAAAGLPLGFTPVPANTVDDVILPDGYAYDVLIRWGDPLFDRSPTFQFGDQTARAQRQQFGYNCDYVGFLPITPHRGLLFVNHEYTNTELMFRHWNPQATNPRQREIVDIELAAHGATVLEIVRDSDRGRWRYVRGGRYNRRLTATTPMRLTGPAAGHPLLRTSADRTGRAVRGMLSNCAGGTTPWGTFLSAEENFDQYFVNAGESPPRVRAIHQRYGIKAGIPEAGHRRWDRFYSRFDLAKAPNEALRFGWVVEVDPFDPDFVPRKRTALGRMKHEGAEISMTEDNRPVAYMGDDERYEYAYKFVSSRRMRDGDSGEARRHNLSLLDHGTLYVARFDGDSSDGQIDGTGRRPGDGRFDGTGRWIKLVSGDRSFVEGMSAAEVLINTRAAADTVGATKMDRPEDFVRHPGTGKVYLALTNNRRRTPAEVDEANPVSLNERADDGSTANVGNKYGHIIELIENNDRPEAVTFRWNIFMLCGNPQDPHTYFAGYDRSQVSPISAPDNLTFDEAGNLWIATDGMPDSLGVHDGFFACPIRGEERGHVQRFLSLPIGAEACGPLITPDQQTIFCAVQHPGEVDGASPDNPASTWPDGNQPRPSVVSIWKATGTSKRIGS